MFALPWNTACVRFLGEIWRAAATLPAGHRPAQPQSRPDVQQPVCEQPDPPPPVQLSCAVWSDSGSGRRPAARVQGSLQRDLHLHPKNESGPRQEQTSSQGRWFPGLCQVIILFTTTLGLIKGETSRLLWYQNVHRKQSLTQSLCVLHMLQSSYLLSYWHTYAFVCQHCSFNSILIKKRKWCDIKPVT